MAKKVAKLLLFTLSACPTGRSLGTVLREVNRQLADVELETIYVDMDPDTTNRHRVKKNPTVLFMDSDGAELYRIEEFQETGPILELIRNIDERSLHMKQHHDDNKPTVENYTVYMFQDEHLVPVDIEYENPTSVRAPRITAIQVLLAAKREGLVNPYPESAKLDAVNFKGNVGDIEISLNREEEPTADNLARMKAALLKTLGHYGIEAVHLILHPH